MDAEEGHVTSRIFLHGVMDEEAVQSVCFHAHIRYGNAIGGVLRSARGCSKCVVEAMPLQAMFERSSDKADRIKTRDIQS